MSSTASLRSLRAVLARNIRHAREQRDWSQEYLAERSGLTQVFVSRLETAKAAATVDTLEKLARAFGEPAYSLLQPLAD